MVRRIIIDRQLRLEIEDVLIGADRTLRAREDPVIVFVTKAKTPRTLFRFRAVTQFYRFKQTPTAEADIAQP